jgi:hypothetical protein
MAITSFDGNATTSLITIDGNPPGTQGNQIGTITVVEDKSDLPAPVGGVITINAVYYLSAVITLDPGVRIEFGANGVITSASAADAGFVGDYDGPLISGPMVLINCSVENTNLGANAKDLFLTSPLGRTVRVEYCSIRGTRAGTIAQCLGAVTIDNTFLNGCGEGFILDQVIGAFQAVHVTTGNNPAGFVGFDVLATCFIAQAITFRQCNFLTSDATDRGIRISSSATLPTGALPTTILGCLISGCFRTGPGQTLEEGPGFFTVEDIEILSRANGSLRDSNIHALCYFFDSTTPAIMAYTGVGTWDVMVTDNTPSGTVMIQDSSTERFTLVINSRQDWYVQYDGPQTDIEKTLSWAIDVSSVTSNNDLEFRITRQISGAGPWLDIPNTHAIVQQVNRKQSIQGFGRTPMDPGDRFRIEVRPVGTSNSSEYYRIQFSAD